MKRCQQNSLAKTAYVRSAKIRQSARGESCTMNSPQCNYNPETVVWCHSNFGEHGKGYGIKAHDMFGFYGCSACHYWLDIGTTASAEEKRFRFSLAHARSLLRLIEKGIVKVA